MIVIVRNDKKREVKYFKYRIISMILYILINKIKGNEVNVIYEKDI